MDNTTITVAATALVGLTTVFLFRAVRGNENPPNFQVTNPETGEREYDGESITCAASLAEKYDVPVRATPRSIEIAIEQGLINQRIWDQRPKTEHYHTEIPVTAIERTVLSHDIDADFNGPDGKPTPPGV